MWPISPSFEEAIKSPVHAIRVKMVVLDTDFQPVTGGTFHDTSYTSDATGILVDGAVDLDVTRGVRRTFTVQLLNQNGEWSPRSDWGGLFYVNRLVRLYRGVQYDQTQSELVPIGTFMIDHADVIVERNMSLVVLSGSDLWKKLNKSQFPHAKSYAAGMGVNAVIKDIADAAGVTRFVFDDLADRSTNAKTLNKKLVFEQGDSRSDALLKIGKSYGLDIYFDPLGRLVTQDFRAPEDTRTVWTYDPNDNGMLLTVKATYNDDNLYNHSLVIATGGKSPITAHVRDTDPTSPTNIDRIGDRVYKYETDDISTVDAAEKAALKLFYRHVLLSEDITLEAICNPALEGNDVVAVRERDFSDINRRYRVKGLSVPLASSRQSIRLQRAIRLTTT